MLEAWKGSCAWAPYLCHEGWVPDGVGTRQAHMPLGEEARFLYGVNRAGVRFIQMCVQHRDKHNLKLHKERSQLHRIRISVWFSYFA